MFLRSHKLISLVIMCSAEAHGPNVTSVAIGLGKSIPKKDIWLHIVVWRSYMNKHQSTKCDKYFLSFPFLFLFSFLLQFVMFGLKHVPRFGVDKANCSSLHGSETLKKRDWNTNHMVPF